MNEPTLEEMLSGDYGGLYGEVVTADIYRLQGINFTPDIVFDVGGNIGIFARYARKLFPWAQIISVEPDPNNCQHFRNFTPESFEVVLLERALGKGQIYHGLTARNGSGETYLSAGLGYPEEMMEKAVEAGMGMVHSNVPTITLNQLVSPRVRPQMKTLLKIDCEGAENSIWSNELSMRVLRRMDYIAIEVHDYALTYQGLAQVKEVTKQALDSLEDTHACERDGVHFWATKKS